MRARTSGHPKRSLKDEETIFKNQEENERKENERFSSATIAHIFQHFHPSRNLINHISPQEQKDHGQQQH